MRKFSIQAIPLAVSALHFLYCIYLYNSTSEGSWLWFGAFTIDLPFSLILINAPNWMSPLFSYGVLGSIWWYFIASAVIFICRKFLIKK